MSQNQPGTLWDEPKPLCGFVSCSGLDVRDGNRVLTVKSLIMSKMAKAKLGTGRGEGRVVYEGGG